ncbi:MAG: endolytic transglycosylase MltG [Lachnospiraceae bacterium]|nr:endolytic transglycosylase MltG [Lachnospiraceae bacterium]
MNNGQTVIDVLTTIVKYVLLALMILFIISTAHRAYDLGYDIFAQKPVAEKGEGEEVTVEITQAMSVRQIGTVLEKAGIIEDGEIFRYQERLSEYHGKLKPGTYTLSSEMTPDEIMEIMSPEDEEEDS